MVRCYTCKTTDSSLFYKDNSRSSGFSSQCKVCSNARKAQQLNARKPALRSKHLKNTYGITEQDYSDMLTAQNGCCKICGVESCRTGKRFAVDHCHKTGKVRGVLCMNCNTVLGYYEKHKTNIENYLGDGRL